MKLQVLSCNFCYFLYYHQRRKLQEKERELREKEATLRSLQQVAAAQPVSRLKHSLLQPTLGKWHWIIADAK